MHFSRVFLYKTSIVENFLVRLQHLSPPVSFVPIISEDLNCHANHRRSNFTIFHGQKTSNGTTTGGSYRIPDYSRMLSL